jgi:3-hydroxyisobutyrate dehydrogenase and related beta-hydroxyacid dehydrogenases
MQFDRDSKIAFLGMGLMGSRMATRLLEAGFQVAVWNRTASACDPLLALGATPLSLDQIADYPVILTCLADDAAVQSVFEQIQPHLVAGQIIVDFSSFPYIKPKL